MLRPWRTGHDPDEPTVRNPELMRESSKPVTVVSMGG
jgi:hypothetical protein